MATKKVSLKEVAKEAGVSTTLVSFVLNNQGRERRVNKATEEHILKVAKKLRYQPNIAAKSLRSGHTNIIGVVVSDISNPFFAQIVRIIEDVAINMGYTVFFGSSDENAEKMDALINTFINRGVDGIMVVPCEHSQPTIQKLIDNKVPTVLLDRAFKELNVTSVTLDNFNAAYKATRHLINAGYTSPVMVAYDIDLPHMKDRVEGYKEAMRFCNKEDKISVAYFSQSILHKEDGSIVQQFLDRGADSLIFGSNTIGFTCLDYIKHNGIQTPQIGLISFDDSDVFKLFVTSLTCITQPLDVLSQTATELLIARIADPDIPVQHIEMNGILLVRESSSRK